MTEHLQSERDRERSEKRRLAREAEKRRNMDEHRESGVRLFPELDQSRRDREEHELGVK